MEYMNIEYGPGDDREDPWDLEGPPKIWSRQEWGAVPSSSKAPVKHPVKYIRFTDTGGGQCITHEQCVAIVQQLQKDHMDKEKLPDIKYNFLIGGDGAEIFEGRGWYRDAFRPRKMDKYKGNTIDIAFIGTYTDTYYPRFFEIRSLEVSKLGMINGFISEDPEIIRFDGTVVISPPTPEE